MWDAFETHTAFFLRYKRNSTSPIDIEPRYKRGLLINPERMALL